MQALQQTSEQQPLSCRPFVKWVGGKSQLLPELLARVPENYNHYFEPFVGGGALFFALQPQNAKLSDINTELINCYKCVKSNITELIKELEKHIYDKDYFYKMRNVDRTEEYLSWSSTKKAARLIYLNKTCFNGLYRVNSKGQFNTPFGRHSNPKIVDKKNLLTCRSALKNAKISEQSFLKITKDAQSNDFVYFDPPYVPLNDTSYFTSYSKDGFGPEEQTQLRDTCKFLDQKDVKFMASNSSTDFVKELYQDFKIEAVQAKRAINSKGTKRGKIEEVIIRNY